MATTDDADKPVEKMNVSWKGRLSFKYSPLSLWSIFNRRSQHGITTESGGDDSESSPARLSPRQLGQLGERLAARYLADQGYQIVVTNFRGPIGRRSDGRSIEGEIDLIAYDQSLTPPVLVFVEVKMRRDEQLARPEAAVDHRKRLRIIRTARLYRRLLSLRRSPFRFDVISILLLRGAAPRLVHLKSFFQDHQ
jgi:putative endonuclease